ncbi:MAG TPA: HupE/UreJ family protein [Candidatus Udaeobacter sp.]|nr:HupE/UreJ family protein [Candidatus Udaeobacter sp.]
MLPFQYANGHDPGLSSLTIRQRPNGLEATLTLAVKDAAQVAELDKDHDGIVTQAEFAQTRSQLETAVARLLFIAADGKVAKAQSVRGQLDENNNVEVRLNFHVVGFSSLEIQSKIIASLPLGHRQYLQIQNSTGQTLFERLLSAPTDRATVELPHTDASTVALEAARSFANFLCLGVKHILTGYDHLLFLFGLLLVAGGFFSSLGIITSFTIAHSITLAVATLQLVQIPSRIVEPLIAASIVFVGIENLLRGDIPKARRMVPFGFGLVHGFGFASALREAGIGSGTGGVVLPLFSFNLGVELGQIMVAAVALPIIWKLRENPMFIARWAPACSAAVVLLGSFWFVQRVWMT